MGFGFLFGNAAGNESGIYTRRSTSALHRRCSSTLCVRNSECAAYYRLHAQATGYSERRLSQRFRQTSRASGLGEVIRERLARTFPPWTPSVGITWSSLAPSGPRHSITLDRRNPACRRQIEKSRLAQIEMCLSAVSVREHWG